jgi:hypothetical protein
MAEIYDCSNIPMSYHDSDYQMFADWYNNNVRNRIPLFNEDIPTVDYYIQATNKGFILYTLNSISETRQHSHAAVNEILEAITPLMVRLRANCVFDFDILSPLIYVTENDDIYDDLTDEEKNTNTQLIRQYDQMIENYANILDISLEEARNIFREEYTQLKCNVRDYITFEIMVNVIEQRLVTEFITRRLSN